ncbi:MAG TPA: hypothetical protein VNS50_01920, partial [Ginsengibacter sp.]|nr:hypothetical protein [Ginsengibacter sp.]
PSSPGVTPADVNSAKTNASNQGDNLLDKISDFILGETGEEIEAFAKEKLGGFFGESKTV